MFKALHGTTYVFNYVFAIAEHAASEELKEISFEEVHSIMKRFAIRAQVNREIEAGKKWRDYRKKAQEPAFMREAADKTVTAMVLWGLLERSTYSSSSERKERMLFVNRPLIEIGNAISDENVYRARLMLFDRILRCEKESAFTPRLLTTIRDSETPSGIGSEFALPSKGVISWSPNFVRNNLKIGQVDFRMVLTWFQELRILNVFNPQILQIKAPQEIYLTAWIALSTELSRFYSKTMKGNQNGRSNSDIHCAKILEFLGVLRINNGLAEPLSEQSFNLWKNERLQSAISDVYQTNLILLGEEEDSWNLVTSSNEKHESVYVITINQPSTDDFTHTLKKNYDLLRMKFGTPYVWIAPLRSLVCRILMINDRQFDLALTDLYKQKPEAIELSKAATGVFRKRVRVFEKPFKLYGSPFRMIRLVDNI